MVGEVTNNVRGGRALPTSAVVAVVILLVGVVLRAPVFADEQSAAHSEESASELAKKTQNPVADLISVPFQSNFNFNTGPREKTAYVLNVQPVIPIHLTEDWNLITRVITPIINLPAVAPGFENAAGLGDINPTFFLSPVGTKKLIWGVGPTFTFPTASNKNLGSGKWIAGPAGVLLTMQGPWVAGALLNQQWSFAGWGDKTFNQLLCQPFVNYNFEHGWYLTTSPIVTSNWTARANQQWTLPVGFGGGKLFRLREVLGSGIGNLGKLPVNVQLQGFYNAIRPDFTANWTGRAELVFLFPK
jgi:hypothetical protein